MTLEPLAIGLVLLSALMHAGWNLLAKLGPDRLCRVRVWEDPTLFVDYDGA